MIFHSLTFARSRGVPIDELSTLCTFEPLALEREGRVRLTHSYAGAIQDGACFMTIPMCSYC